MRSAILFGALAIGLSAPARAEPISISAGETITIQFDGDLPVVVNRSTAPPLSPYENALLERLQRMSVPPGTIAPPVPVMKDEIGETAPAIIPGQISLTFRRVPSADTGKPGDSLLTLRDGYQSTFRYRAMIHASGRWSQTDVCTVAPGLLGTEHWPYVIEQIEITDLKLEPATGEVSCE